MTTLELQAAKLGVIETLLSMDDEQFVKVKKYVKNLAAKAPATTYEMPEELLEELLKASEEDFANGRYVEEKEMDNFINSLR